MSFGKPLFKLRKLIRSKFALIAVVVFCALFLLLRFGIVRVQPRKDDGIKHGQDQSYWGHDRPASTDRFDKNDLKNIVHRRPINGLGENMLSIDDGHLKKDYVTKEKNNEIIEGRIPYHKKSQKTFLELVDETNPSHSLDSDRNYKASDLKILAQSMNEGQAIMNKDKFPDRDKDGVIIVIQVHKRLKYLIELLSSLENAKGIENSLLIISSDWYSDGIVEAVKKIRFCQVMHIFFPFAAQLHPDAYPGSDPNDCPRDIGKEEAKKKQCINSDYPDKYGHYREAKFTMTKHHWWWKANVVFDKLLATKNSKGPVVFLEEDHYVAPDFYHSIIQLHKLKQSDARCQNSCDILNLGMYVKAENYFANANNQVSLTKWRSYDHNMGMTMYRSSWETIKQCSKVFCTHDDYNWDWTLMHISLTCLKKPLFVLSMDLPRVFHIGQCGMHHDGDCNTRQEKEKYSELIERNAAAFFPDQLEIGNTDEGNPHSGIDNGGWGDKRDHDLCHSFVKKTQLAGF